MIRLSLLLSCIGTFGFVHAGDIGNFFRSDVIQSVCKCRPGEWRRYDAFQQAAHPGPSPPSPSIEPSLRLDDGLGADDLLAGSGKVVSFNKDDWATAVLRNHDVYILIEDRSELEDVIIRGIRFNVHSVIKVALQVLEAGNWTTFAQKHTPEGENVTEIDLRFSSAECEENCYGLKGRLKGQLIRILLEPIDAWHVAEIDGLVVDLCQIEADAIYNAVPQLHVECLQTPDGRDYVGNVNRSISGRRCLPWSSSVLYQALRSRFPDGLDGAENRCRNPSSVRTGPFCLTRINGKTAEEPCYIPSCRLPEVADMELTCAVGEFCSFNWANAKGVKVASTVTLRSPTGGPANELDVFTVDSTLADEIEWSNLSDPTFNLTFEFEPEKTISGFDIVTEGVVALTLHHSRDGRQWTPLKTLDIPLIMQATQYPSSWRAGSSRCHFQCNGIKSKYIRLTVKGVGSHVAPKLSMVYIKGCSPLEALTSVCEFGPSRLIDFAYRNHVVLRSNMAMLTNIENILENGLSYVQADQASFQETRRHGHQPYVEFSFRTSRSFVVKRVDLYSWYVRKIQLLGSRDGKTWTLIGNRNLNVGSHVGSPLDSRLRWPLSNFIMDAGGCPHTCSGVQVKYLRLVVEESVSAQAPWFKDLKIHVCFNNNTSPVPTVECKSKTNGYTYSGHENKSSTGLPCRPWKDSPYWRNSLFPPDGTVEEASSYCRHPDTYMNPRHPRGPWCFTEDGDQYCDIPVC